MVAHGGHFAIKPLLTRASTANTPRDSHTIVERLQPGGLDRLVAILAHDGLWEFRPALHSSMEQFDDIAHAILTKKPPNGLLRGGYLGKSLPITRNVRHQGCPVNSPSFRFHNIPKTPNT